MEFRKEIKQLEKEYYHILKQHYNTSRLVLKMIAMHNSSELSEPEVCFMTCNTYSFSDECIDKLYLKNPERAIQTLRVRGVCCMQTMQAIDNLIINCTRVDEKGLAFIDKLKNIRNRLEDLAKCSLNKSNIWSQKHSLPYISINNNYEIRHYRCQDKILDNFDAWNIDKFK